VSAVLASVGRGSGSWAAPAGEDVASAARWVVRVAG
jgi:hypothetical protein